VRTRSLRQRPSIPFVGAGLFLLTGAPHSGTLNSAPGDGVHQLARSPDTRRDSTTTPCIEQWLVVISGFLQDEGQPTGMVDLWAQLHHLHSGPTTRVELRSWDDDWHAVAEFIWRQRPPGNHLDVCLFAYSWGGPSAMELARQLGRRGISVRRMVLSDPVYRNLWKLWRVFFRWPTIAVPANVQRVTWFRQHRDWPAGHDLVAEGPDTQIDPPEVLERGHSYMDESLHFKWACLEAAKGGD